MPFKIRRFRHEMQVGKLEEADTDGERKILAKRIANDIFPQLMTTGIRTYTVNHRLFDQVASMHTDVWIEKPALHAQLYTNNVQGRNLPTPPAGAIPSTVSKVRGFSGNVSGVIGEATFAWIMREHYKMDERNLVHLRPVKSGNIVTGRYPDFEIHNPSQEFHDAIPATVNRTHLYPFPCEAKGITNPEKSQIEERLGRAIGQLQSYWLFQQRHSVRNNHAGLISLALRNAIHNTYDIFFVWCQ